jgi:HK97 family phage portal protein
VRSRWTTPLDVLASRLRLPAVARREISNISPVPLVRRRSNILDLQRSVAGGDMVTYMEQYATDGVVHPIVSRLSESTAGQDWGLWTRAEKEEDRTEIGSHAVLDLLEGPNNFQSRMQIMEAGQQHFELTGEVSIVLGFLPGVKLPLDMWLLRPDRISPVPDPYAFLKGWVYTAPGDGEKIPIETRELLRMVRPSPLDPYRGMGPIQALLRDLDAQRFGKEWQAAFFANSAQPGGMIEVDRRLEDWEFDEMRDRWAEQHRGVSKAHRVAIIEHGAKWVTNNFSLRDLQMAELDGVGRDKALVAFGFPKSMLGIVEDVNRANAEAGEYVFARWLTRPRLERWRGLFNHPKHGLLSLYGDRTARDLMLDFVDPVPENGEAALQELDIKSQVLVRLVGPEGNMDAGKVLDMLNWPDLGYTAPPPPAPAPVLLPPDAPEDPPTVEPGAEVDNAMRWVATGHEDGNACEPCLKNQGKLYRNRSSAYADYPGGKGYIKCIGAQYGNDCRCKVIRRRSK